MRDRREQSFAMHFFRSIKRERVSWSLRRLHCPVKPSDLVLEVGSGGNPYFRANVLLDAYEDTRERHWAPLVHDRPTVLGFVEHLPFRDKAFDFVIASHVLEHSTDPALFLSELQRVSKAGYIEVPDAFMERINPYRDHRLEITVRDGSLVIRKKVDWKIDSELVELYEDRVKLILTTETMRQHPFQFHVRYYWQDNISYEILNPDVDAGWSAPSGGSLQARSPSVRQKLSGLVMRWMRANFSQHRRNTNINLLELLICPVCRSEELMMLDEQIKCTGCNQFFPVRNDIPILYSRGGNG